jgi:hypothetical protein
MTFGRTAQKPGNPKPRVKDPKSRTAPLGRDDSCEHGVEQGVPRSQADPPQHHPNQG